MAAVKSRPKSGKAVPFLRLAYSAPLLCDSTVEEISRLLLPATKALGFVKLKANDQPLWRPESYWHVKPTGRRAADFRLGRKFACDAIAAMKADHNPHLIAYIIQDLINDATKRGWRDRRSKHNPIVLGFLNGISEAVAAR